MWLTTVNNIDFTGSQTAEILARMGSDARLVALEDNRGLLAARREEDGSYRSMAASDPTVVVAGSTS